MAVCVCSRPGCAGLCWSRAGHMRSLRCPRHDSVTPRLWDSAGQADGLVPHFRLVFCSFGCSFGCFVLLSFLHMCVSIIYITIIF